MAHSSSLSWIRPLLKEAASPEVTLLHEAAHTNDGSSFNKTILNGHPSSKSLWDKSLREQHCQFLPSPNPASLASFQKLLLGASPSPHS